MDVRRRDEDEDDATWNVKMAKGKPPSNRPIKTSLSNGKQNRRSVLWNPREGGGTVHVPRGEKGQVAGSNPNERRVGRKTKGETGPFQAREKRIDEGWTVEDLPLRGKEPTSSIPGDRNDPGIHEGQRASRISTEDQLPLPAAATRTRAVVNLSLPHEFTTRWAPAEPNFTTPSQPSIRSRPWRRPFPPTAECCDVVVKCRWRRLSSVFVATSTATMRRRRKRRTHKAPAEDEAHKVPRSMVVRRGKAASVLVDLERDLRKVMKPYTAESLRESKKNSLKDFVNVAGPLGVSHLLILSASENASYLRIAKTPRGPTLTMKIKGYALTRDVLSVQTRPRIPDLLFKNPPLVVMNNFGSNEPHMKVAAALLQNLFPPIDVQTTHLKSCQRVVLLHMDKETEEISLRHYAVDASPVGVNKNLKKLVAKREVPDMGELQDVADLLERGGYASDSDVEENRETHVTLSHDFTGRANRATRRSAVKLQEIGPRLELELVKLQEGLCDGQVLYHAHIKKTEQEINKQEKAKKDKENLKASRKKQQEENVRKKQALEEAKKQEQREQNKAHLAEKRKRKEIIAEATENASDDDDAAYYKQELGVDQHTDDHVSRKSGKKPKASGAGAKQRRAAHRNVSAHAEGAKGTKSPLRKRPKT